MSMDELLSLAIRLEAAEVGASELGNEAKRALLPRRLGLEANPAFSLDACAELTGWVLPGWGVTIECEIGVEAGVALWKGRIGDSHSIRVEATSKAGVCAAWLAALCRGLAASLR